VVLLLAHGKRRPHGRGGDDDDDEGIIAGLRQS
jgi:hypothetical protein